VADAEVRRIKNRDKSPMWNALVKSGGLRVHPTMREEWFGSFEEVNELVAL
jgi:hypothetical protein